MTRNIIPNSGLDPFMTPSTDPFNGTFFQIACGLKFGVGIVVSAARCFLTGVPYSCMIRV
jgi:hypothetical protein